MDCPTIMTRQIFCPTASVQGVDHTTVGGCCSLLEVTEGCGTPRSVQITTHSPAAA